MSNWNGIFVSGVVVKHRDYCGDITNHIGIKTEEPSFDPETGVGILEVSFNDGDSKTYEFEIKEETWSQYERIYTRNGTKSAEKYLCNWVEEEMKRLKAEAEADSDPEQRT